ncbi:MAG: hypothetical protein IJO28_04790 [Oscillospiraceae bacterium]|nr:hypothetical protein [Oscillospiraceae bacterium]
MILEYEDTYMAWKADEFARLEKLNPKSGAQVQDLCLHDTDESKLTKRERLVLILIAICYEIEHNMLTEELTDELYFYYQDMQKGRLEKILAENEINAIKTDIEKYYKSVF